MPKLRLIRGWETLPASPYGPFPAPSAREEKTVHAEWSQKQIPARWPLQSQPQAPLPRKPRVPGWSRPSGRCPAIVRPRGPRRLHAPHPGDAFLAAQGQQHLGHVAHQARVLHTHHAPLVPQVHRDRAPLPRVGRRRHPCQSSGSAAVRSCPRAPRGLAQRFREGIVPASSWLAPPQIPELREARSPQGAKARRKGLRLRR